MQWNATNTLFFHKVVNIFNDIMSELSETLMSLII